MYVPRSKIVNPPKHKMNNPRSQSVRAEERKIQYVYTLLIRTVNRERKSPRTKECVLFVLKRGMRQSAKHNEYSSFSKRESPIALCILYGALRSPKAGESKRLTL